MPRLRKLRRKQKFQYHVNRRALNKKSNKLPTIQYAAIRNAWDDKKGVNENLTSMGLVADTNMNKSFRIPSGKQQLTPARTLEEKVESDTEEHANASVVTELQKEATDRFKHKKLVAHPLPPEMFKKLTQFLDKYGEDYEAMSTDYLNYNQETPAQIRSQVNRLKKIPQQWTQYLKSRGLIPPDQIAKVCDSSVVVPPNSTTPDEPEVVTGAETPDEPEVVTGGETPGEPEVVTGGEA